MPRLRTLLFLPSVVLVALTLGCGEAPSNDAGAATDEAQPEAERPAPAADESALLNPNEATGEDLRALPHLNGALAEELIAERPYADMLEVDALLAEGGLGPDARDELYAHLFLPLDLNAAGEEEILLIPGVGERMAHEFEEYRPYRGIEEFRREIGKYVDEAEVARLEGYVRIP